MNPKTIADEHLTPEELTGFLCPELGWADLDRVWEHLDHCRECVSYLADVIKLSRAGKDSPR